MSKIRLHGSSSGYMEIAPPAAGSSETITLPNSAGEVLLSDGSAASLTQIPAANIVGVCTAGLGNASGAFTQGKVLQVAQSTKQDAFSYTANSTDPVDITGTDQNGSGSVFSVKITPSSASNKILFTCSFMLGMKNGTAYTQGFMKRDSTTLLPGTHGTGNMVNCTFGVTATGSGYYVENANFTVLDSPNSTSELTYKVQFGKGDGSYELYINRPYLLDNQPYNTLGSSTLTVMEIAA